MSLLCNLDEYITTPPLYVPRNGEMGWKNSPRETKVQCIRDKLVHYEFI